MEKKRITLSTSALNRNGYRVLTSGIKLERYQRNPVLLFDHTTWRLPVGMVEDIRIEGDNLTGIPVFDENEEMGRALKAKMQNGFPLAASIGFDVITYSEQGDDLVEGQRFSTVTECDLLEVSIVAVPGNPDATLSVGAPHTLSAIPPISHKTLSPDMDFKKIALALGLPENADENAVMAAINQRDEQIKTLSANQVNELLSVGEASGVVTAENKEQWRKLATADYQSASSLIKGAKVEKVETPAPATASKPGALLTGMLSAGKVAPTVHQADEREGWSFDDWQKKDQKGLLLMKKEKPDQYQKLAADYYEQS